MPRRARVSNKVKGESKMARRMRRRNAMKQPKRVVVTKEQADLIKARMKIQAEADAAAQAMVSPNAIPGDASAIASVLGVEDDGSVRASIDPHHSMGVDVADELLDTTDKP